MATLTAALENLTAPPVVVYAADRVAVATLTASGDLDIDGAIFLDADEARRLAADLLDAAVKAATAPPATHMLYVVGGRK